MRRLSIIILLLVVTNARADDPRPWSDPFADAAVAPADVSVFVHVQRAGELAADLRMRPIAGWLETLLGGGELEKAWRRLGEGLEMKGPALFDLLLGQQATFMGRGGGEGVAGPPAQWALLSSVDPGVPELIRLSALQPRVQAPRGNVAVAAIPEHDLLVAARDGRLLVGPRSDPGLFYEVIDRLVDGALPALDGEPAIEKARRLGGGDVGVLLRHGPPLGGWSAAVANVHGSKVGIRHAAVFDSPPFQGRLTRTEVDFSPVAPLEGRSLLVMMEPTDTGDGSLEWYVSNLLGAPLLDDDLLEHLGERCIVTVGETEGRLLQDPMDVLSTTAAFCFEVDCAAVVRQPLEEHMGRLSRSIARLGTGSLLRDLQAPLVAPPNAPREPAPATTLSLTDGFPIMRNVQLSWGIADGPHGSWCVVALHHNHLADVIDGLERPTTLIGTVGRYESVGSADGVRIGRHLRSWSESDELFPAGDGEGGPEGEARERELRSTLRTIAAFCDGVQRCRWRLARPSREEMRLDVQVILAPPRSGDKR